MSETMDDRIMRENCAAIADNSHFLAFRVTREHYSWMANEIERLRSALASAEAAALERAAQVVEQWSLPTIQTPSMWLIDKAGIAAEIRSLIPPGHSPASAGEAEVENKALAQAHEFISSIANESMSQPVGLNMPDAQWYQKRAFDMIGRAARWLKNHDRAALASAQAQREGQK